MPGSVRAQHSSEGGAMRLQVKGRHIDVTDSLFQYAEKKLGKLARHLSDESRCELELIVEHNPSINESQVAEATVWTKGPVLRARESSTDMYASIDLVADKLERQVKRYRERKRRGSAHGGAPRTRSPEPPPLPSLIQTEDDERELPPLEDEPGEPTIVK